MKRGKRLMIVAAAALASVGLGAWIFRGHGDVQYRTAAVERGEIADTVSAIGTPNAVVTVQVGSQVSGNIIELDADFNTKVQKDQVVARIDPQIFQARVDQARATLNAAQAAVVNAQAQIEKSRADMASAQAAVENAKANVVKAKSAVNDAKPKLDRRIQLVNEGVLSKEDGETAQSTYDQAVASATAADAQVVAAQQNVTAAQAQVRVAETQLSSAQAQVKQDQAALEQAEADLAHTYIRAPVDGVVVARNVDVGQTVAASLQAPTLFQIAQDLTKMQVDTNVSEADVGRVQVGMPATFTVDAYPGRIFRGAVSSIRKAAINVQNVVTYDVVVSVSNPDQKLFPGMTANVKILITDHPDALKVPNAALRYRPDNAAAQRSTAGSPIAGASSSHRRGGNAPDQHVIWILDAKNDPKPVTVALGISDGTFTEVTGGRLQEGDRVVVAAFSNKGSAAASSASPFGGGGRPAGGPRGGF